MPGGAVARVLVDSPLPQLDQLFDYAIPERLRASAVAGVRVRVPLRTGGRIANGWLVEVVDQSEYQGALSELDDIAGIGPGRKKALLKRFGSVRRMREASVEEVAAVPGISRDLAERLKSHLAREGMLA